MEAAPVVTLIAVALTVAVLAAFLIAVALILKRVSAQLEVILGAVSEVADKTAPMGEVIGAINADLTEGHAALEDAVTRLKERTGAETEKAPVSSRAGQAEW